MYVATWKRCIHVTTCIVGSQNNRSLAHREAWGSGCNQKDHNSCSRGLVHQILISYCTTYLIILIWSSTWRTHWQLLTIVVIEVLGRPLLWECASHRLFLGADNRKEKAIEVLLNLLVKEFGRLATSDFLGLHRRVERSVVPQLRALRTRVQAENRTRGSDLPHVSRPVVDEGNSEEQESVHQTRSKRSIACQCGKVLNFH